MNFKHIRKVVIFWFLVVVTFPIQVIFTGTVCTIEYIRDIFSSETIDRWMK